MLVGRIVCDGVGVLVGSGVGADGSGVLVGVTGIPVLLGTTVGVFVDATATVAPWPVVEAV